MLVQNNQVKISQHIFVYSQWKKPTDLGKMCKIHSWLNYKPHLKFKKLNYIYIKDRNCNEERRQKIV